MHMQWHICHIHDTKYGHDVLNVDLKVPHLVHSIKRSFPPQPVNSVSPPASDHNWHDRMEMDLHLSWRAHELLRKKSYTCVLMSLCYCAYIIRYHQILIFWGVYRNLSANHRPRLYRNNSVVNENFNFNGLIQISTYLQNIEACGSFCFLCGTCIMKIK